MPADLELRSRESDFAISDNTFSPKAKKTQELVNALAKNYRETSQSKEGSMQNSILMERDLKKYAAWLTEAHSYFREASDQDLTLPLASEWMLDNYYIIRQAILQIGEDLPASFYKQLPKLADGLLKGLPRIYAIERAVLSSQNYLLDVIELQAIMTQVHQQVPLTMGELWALPIFLRYSLIETLAHALERIVQPQTSPDLPAFPVSLTGSSDPLLAQQTEAGESFANAVVANIILSLRAISEQNWNDFFETVSLVEWTLREDPACVYPLMDFKTRDQYRKEIEALSLACGCKENELAKITLDLARENHTGGTETAGAHPETSARGWALDNPAAHIGEYLLGGKRSLLEEKIGYRPDVKTALKRWGFRHASALYLGSIGLLSVMLLALSGRIMTLPVIFQSGSVLQWMTIPILALSLLATILTVSASLVNWLVTLWVKPSTLPKLRFKDNIPTPYQTLVVIPALILSEKEIDFLVRQLEMHHLCNPEPGLLFALLTDFGDADYEEHVDDEKLLKYAASAIEDLNAQYKHSIDDQATTGDLFYLLHRKRLWNGSEGKWMGWERKRGKLHELNCLLRGGENLSFSDVASNLNRSAGLQHVRFVITLDADTILPLGAAARLIGALAHPLNRARFDEITGRVVSGYTVLQPRMEMHPRSANYSWFTQIFAGDTGLDLYTRAVSDVYQDLFGEGIYVGKGIYDLDAFERSLNKRIPENSVLSHDLLEGILGRAGLVTDVTMVEDYPSNYLIKIERLQRWIRGDWQLLPWLLQPGKFGVRFSAISRWKILDNLLRSTLVPALLLIFILGVIIFPDLAWFWVVIVLLSLGIPVFTGIARGAMQTLGGEKIGASFHDFKLKLMRWLLAISFLPYEAYKAADAILTTLYRLFVSRRDFLQWTTAAQAAHIFGLEAHRKTTWFRMSASTLLALIVFGGIHLAHWMTGRDATLATALAAPLLLLWTFSPLISHWITQPITTRTMPLDEAQEILFRQVARRTWGFFERFVGPEDHWLPPDHFQEAPVGTVAHRTSPSNIGLLLISTLAAYDFGYLDQLGLATRLSTTIDALDKLGRFRGHFYNWYDTQTLQPLNPRYISTVDSGNLAACLIVMTQGCKKMTGERIFRWRLWQGYLDTLSILTETLAGMRKSEFVRQVEEINHRIAEMSDEILSARRHPTRWYALFQIANEEFWPDISSRLAEMVAVGHSAFGLEGLRKLQEVAAQIDRHHQSIRRTLDTLVPWVHLMEQIPSILTEDSFQQGLNALRADLAYNPPLCQVRSCATAGQSDIALLGELLQANQPVGVSVEAQREALEWLEAMEKALDQAGSNADLLSEGFTQIAIRAEQFVNEMDFNFLFHPERRVFHIGLNLENGQLDKNFYDLLASEARIASIIAMAKGDIPQSHWIQLNRPLIQVEGGYILLSWSATMFEYLMPPLFLRSYRGTLLSESAWGAVEYQIAYGKEKGVPWGISESGFYLFDANHSYQYRAFGVPGLGYKRGLGDDLVIAPYASLMAISYNPQAVARNLVSLIEHNCLGLYGLYEAIDFTANRLPQGNTSKIIKEYMAHHQGMIMMALVNYFYQDIMIQRMHSDPRIQRVELLLQEQIPHLPVLQNPFAEHVSGLLRLKAGPVDIKPWSVPVHTAIPQINLLSNGNYRVLLSNMGGGYSACREIDLTRWQADGVLDPWGTWIYIQDIEPNLGQNALDSKLWSAGYQPIPSKAENMQVTFYAHMAVFRRTENGITSNVEVTVCPNDLVEIRRVHLHNNQDQHRHLRLTSYGEVILTQQAADNRHPAFNKLFIESEFVAELNLQIFTRRRRANDETPIFLGHMLVADGKGESRANPPAARHEADRNRFIGRGRSLRRPWAMVSEEYLTGTTGATLDPIFALGQEIDLRPHASAELAYLTFVADSREALLALARRYSQWSLIESSFHQANLAAQSWLGKQNYDSKMFKNTLQVLSALIYPFKVVRTTPETIAANRLGQPGLWRFGISGDYPIVLVEIEDPKQVDLIRDVLQMQEFFRSRRFVTDVVILNYQQTDYGAELNGILHRLINRLNYEQWLHQRGGIFILYRDQISADEFTLLHTAGRFIFKGERGSMAEQMPEYPLKVLHLPKLIPTRAIEGVPIRTQTEESPLPSHEPLQFYNGYGGFGKDGREYIIELLPGEPTPAPWVNVIGYPNFGFMVSETGSQSTWAINSGENRLTPWSNDPVCDPTGEALYLRDEETGEVWSPTPLPAGADHPYRVIHGAGYTIFDHHSHGLRQHLTLFASPEDPVKIICLRIENAWNYTRRITATQYIEWVLGANRAAALQYIVPEYDAAEACLLATNPSNAEFGERAAFLIASKSIHGLTADRTEFLGRGGTSAFPVALDRLGLETRLSPGEDPCAVLQVYLDLLPGAVEEIYFVLGQGDNKQHALDLARKYHDSANVSAALEQSRAFWEQLLNTVQVRTPEPAIDVILNRWMLYQTLSCRIWGRTAFYQSGGAFGFRDQLQDVLALLPVAPSISRLQILNAAQRQFTEGDVLHWWHPPYNRGVRTRISDDLLWLPYVTARYIETTGDVSILDEKTPFLEAEPLRKEEIERYNVFQQTRESYSLFEHCQRAIQKGATRGANALPLIGTGDWNDGFNRVGRNGKGESVWLGWFLCEVLERFAKICELREDGVTAKRYRSQSQEYAAAIEKTAWDGAWYQRAYFDDGSPLGSIQNTECQIDGIAQSWSVLSKAGNAERSRQAMRSVLERLVLPQERMSLLFTPPFDKSGRDPGYIKGYHPGTRENGGQYSHAAIWTAMAFTHLGDGKLAGELFDLLNPIFLADSQEKAEKYRVEPYVMSADIYSKPPFLGRGGWTWYTGSAAWMYQLGLSALLGFNKAGDTLQIDPVIPPNWDGFEISYQFGTASYHIKVSNPQHVANKVQIVRLDGMTVTNKAIPLVDDGQEHHVEVIMG
jgi:cyclic beta-1,2-glucan synthetase